MTGVADALTKLGYVRREFGTADRRVVFLAITLAGRVQLEKIARADLAAA
jgi:DNA-binding MarR family transcriptional regulator